MATATMTKKSSNKAATEGKKRANPDKARSVLVKAILTTLDRRSWTSRAALVEAVGKLVPVKKAVEVYEYRIGLDESQKVKVARGRTTQVMLTCITLFQHGKIEQRGRGETKEYRLI